MITIEFNYEQQIIEIQTNIKDTFQEAINKYLQKSLLDKESIMFLANGLLLKPEKTIESQMNSLNEKNNNIKVLVNKIDKPEQVFIKSKDIICPRCQGLCRIKYDDLTITCYDCENNHKIEDILLSEFDEKQKINLSNIICNECKLKNRGESYNYDFYICLTCNKNICPLCKSKHSNEDHNIIKYEQKNYICQKHNDTFFKYCQDCKKNICIICEKEHKEHKMIFFGDIIPNIDDLKNKFNEKKKEIESFKENVKDLMKELNEFVKIIDKYIDINNELLNNYDIRKKNYNILANINEINNDNDILKNIRDINNMSKKILDIFKLNKYEKGEKELKIKLEQFEKEKEERKRKEIIEKEKSKKEIENSKEDKEKLEKNLTIILKKIKKFNVIIEDFKRDIKLEPIIIEDDNEKSLFNISDSSKIIIRVENYEEGTVYYWPPEKFYERYDLAQELFERFYEENLDLTTISKEEDPLWDEPKHSLLGYALYRLEPLAYLMSNPVSINIVSPSGDVVGKLDVDLIPHDENDNEFDEVPETPSDLIGQDLKFKVSIIGVKDLPKNFCRKLKIEYQTFYDKKTYSTKIYNENDSNLTEFKINENIEHEIVCLTKEDIEYLEKEGLCFKVYAFEDIEKKGRKQIEPNELKKEYENLKEFMKNEKDNKDKNITNKDNKEITDEDNINKDDTDNKDEAKTRKNYYQDCNIF